MSEKLDNEAGSNGVSPDESARLLARRRFTRAGLSAPVVLGTLVSKPVLGQSGPPYNCTVSGQVSGNLSHPGDFPCATLGSNRSYWLMNAWPGAMGATKGDLPNNGCNFPGSTSKGTLFYQFGNGVAPPGLASAFFTGAGGGQCSLVDSGSTSARASLYEVLALQSAAGEKFDLGRATVVSLCNYYSNPSRYPVTPHTIIAMFNATYNGGTYTVNSSGGFWTRRQVLIYLTSLYPPG